jgi:integrase
MARRVHRLSPLRIRTLGPGLHADGLNLYLQVTDTGARSWVFRYSRAGKSTDLGLGSIHTTSLIEARDLAHEARRQLRDGIDPLEARRQAKQKKALTDANTITFKAAADQYIAAHCASWSNVKHAGQWRDTLATYAHPTIGELAVRAVDTALVLRVLEPIWKEKPDTASRLRGRIESILDWAKVKGYRDGENPARWRGHLDQALPKKSKIRKVEHHAALPYPQLPAFLIELRKQQGIAARALEFCILTATRSGETIGAKRNEINLSEKTWTIPAERMKAGVEHRVPLCDRAITILEDMEAARGLEGGFVFPGNRRGKPLSENAMYVRLQRMGRADLTVHGMRSTFRDWAAERTAYPNHVVEQALAHTIGNAVEAAYRRTDLFDQRHRLMDAWGEFCCTSQPAPELGKVVPMVRTA